MIKLMRYLRDYKLESVVGPLFKFFEACLELLVPIVMARVIDVGVKNGDSGYILRMGAVLAAFALSGVVCALTAQYFAAKASMGFGTKLRADLYRHVNRLSFAELDTAGAPTLITRLTSDANQAQASINLTLRLLLRSPFIVLGAIAMAFTIDARLTLIFIGATALLGLCVFFVMRATIPLYRRIQSRLDCVSRLTRESLSGARVIRAFSRQASEKADYEAETGELLRAQVRAGRLSALLNPATSAIVNAAIALLVWQGGYRVFAGGITQGEVVALVNYMTQILVALLALSNLIVQMARGSASAARLNELFALRPSIVDGPGAQTEEGANAVEFQRVSFRYPGAGAPSLADVSFAAPRGSTIGVIGGTGSGKSTLVNLIPRLYDATEGSVKVFGADVKQYRLRELRGRIGVAPQRAALFRGTIRENLQWGKPGATDEEITRALTVAQAADFVFASPEGLDRHIEQGGRNLSGGQRQRLTIARALVGEPDILILDDSASALDYATDARLRRAIRENTRDMTVFIVSQRVSSIRQADAILVLDDARLAGVGTHEALMRDCAVYREIALSQEKEAKA